MTRRLFANIFGLQKSRDSARDGSSRRGRRYADSDREGSNRDSSTHSALFDLELSQRGVQAADLARLQPGQDVEEVADPSLHLGCTLQRVIYLGRPLMEFELDLLQDVKSIREVCSDSTGLVLAKVAEELEFLGYAIEIRMNNPTDPGYRHNVDKGCLGKLRHTYIVCHGRRDGSVQHTCIVDPRFREQFQVGHPTPGYTSLLRAVPMEFVGSPLRLQALVNLLCAEIAAAYASQDLPLPPWRKVNALLSKWFTPADMAVGAAVAAGMLQPVSPQQEDDGLEGKDEDVNTGLQEGTALPPLTAAMAAVAGPQFGQQRALAQQALPQFLLQHQQVQPPVQQLGALGMLPMAPPTSQFAPPPNLAEGGLAVGGNGGGPAAQGMHFFEALSLHQASLRQQQQQQQHGRPAAQELVLQQEQQHGGTAYQEAVAALALQQSHYPDGRAPASGFPQGGNTSDVRMAGCTNHPRRQLREAQAEHQSQQQRGQTSIWGPVDEVVHGDSRLEQGGKVSSRQISSWTDLSTILETHSTQSSPRIDSFANGGGGSTAALAVTTGGGHTGASSASPAVRDSQAASVYGATAHSSATPVLAFSGQSVAWPSPSRGSGMQDREGSKRGGRRVVSLLAKGLKSMGNKQTWASLLPNVNIVRRQGGSHEGSSRGGSRWGAGDRSWRGIHKKIHDSGADDRSRHSSAGGDRSYKGLLPEGEPRSKHGGHALAGGQHKSPVALPAVL